MSIEAMKQALEALEVMRPACFAETTLKAADTAITALRERLKQPEQEPVATVTNETGADITMSWWHEPALPVGTPLYTTPPQRPWVALTEEEVNDIVWNLPYEPSQEDIRAIEAKLKEKNNG